MNIRKNTDYSEMYAELDMLMAKVLSQMELYCGIGKAVCRRTEKGAAVMASEYLNKHYPDAKGFSPRNLRRMRDFYRTYENHSALLSRAMKLGWIQNVVIMEADLTMELREWYMKAAKQFRWSKIELLTNIKVNAHESVVVDATEEVQCIITGRKESSKPELESMKGINITTCMFIWIEKLWLIWRKSGRRLGFLKGKRCRSISQNDDLLG